MLEFPIRGRSVKPRQQGLTMVIDKGMGPRQTADLLDIAAAHIDLMKFGFGTAMVYPPAVLAEKAQAIKAAGVDVYPGGTLLELAVYQAKVAEFFGWCRTVGFTFVEVSDGTIDIPRPLRRDLIARAKDMGFGVISEVGKKDPSRQLGAAQMADSVYEDLQAGAWKVIVEARDAGHSVGVFDDAGRLREHFFDDLLQQLSDVDDVIWEAPRVDQQRALLLRLGPNASFGNVQPEDVISLEAMRVGLRNDTLRPYIEARPLNKEGIHQTI